MKTREWPMLCAFVLQKQWTLLGPKFLQISENKQNVCIRQYQQHMLWNLWIPKTQTWRLGVTLTCNGEVSQVGSDTLELPTAFWMSIKNLLRIHFAHPSLRSLIGLNRPRDWGSPLTDGSRGILYFPQFPLCFDRQFSFKT